MATTSSPIRRSTRYRRPPPPPFVPTPPSADYLALSEIRSTRLPPNSDKPESRKLLVLDLNGTLVLRSPRTYNAARAVMPRPFSKTFKDYVFREGSHLDVMVWSSAQPHSVHSMLESFFGSDRKRLVGIWARDTLGLASEHYSQKVQTIKDLNTIWNAPAGLPPPVKVMPPPPMAILTDNPTSIPGYDPTRPPPEPKTFIHTSLQLMPESTEQVSDTDRTGYFETPEVRLDDPIPGLSTIDPDTNTVESVPPTGLYSALNSLLLDDSALKAHLQPYNHLTLPEYTAELRARDVRRRNAIDALAGSGLVVEDDVEDDPKDGEWDDSVERDGVGYKEIDNEHQNHQYQVKKHLRAAPYDKSLLAVIGVLDAVRYESSLVGWMKAGGMCPSETEMERVAALFSEGKNQSSISEEGGDAAEDRENDHSSVQTIPAKRPLDSLSTEQASQKRARPILLGENTALAPSAGLADEPAENEDKDNNKAFNPAASINNPPLTDKEPTSQPTKRKRHRKRQKHTYPADHPLSANDPYPFFTDGKPETKLWFQDRDIYAYWVRRGLLALKECGIEPEAGIDIDV
ncbi:eukaryotic translation initiation factor 3 subunit A [Rhizoctonia solani AG-3 Rhs1AP]|uniref:Mitochondrial import inner membrane translocase subunit TIM50 n=1 Tax=Rhizoctonia solani AG-3 Rhs1AP TaxID=1086054 RepID=X8JMS1_9AGAM|nr:eukaryotic translation initiation factor 3 subunit A [Rhizoctonia solani AG-3 Rhs1AP]